jgi:hypothetical protein
MSDRRSRARTDGSPRLADPARADGRPAAPGRGLARDGHHALSRGVSRRPGPVADRARAGAGALGAGDGGPARLRRGAAPQCRRRARRRRRRDGAARRCDGGALAVAQGGGPFAPARWPLVYLSPRGARFDQAMARRWRRDGITLICGRFEGLDQRVIDHFGIEEVSMGDFVLTGGEIAAQALIDAASGLYRACSGIRRRWRRSPSARVCWSTRSTRNPPSGKAARYRNRALVRASREDRHLAEGDGREADQGTPP